MELTAPTPNAPSDSAAMVSSTKAPRRPLDPRRVLLAQTGDREALDALLRALQERIYRFILSLVGKPDLAEDILQETFLLICRKIGWLREPDLIVPWAFRIARRECFHRMKSLRTWSELDEGSFPAVSGPPEDLRCLLAHEPDLGSRVESLPPAARVVVQLHYSHELSIFEVAAVLEIPVGTAKSRLAAGVAALRRMMTEPPAVSVPVQQATAAGC